MEDNLKQFILMLADNNMILGQRLSEWCGHGPILEQDIAITNISLDLIGEARTYYQYLADVEGKNEDDYPMLRDAREFRNALITEQPNGHWGTTIIRQLIFDCWHFHHLQAMTKSSDKTLAAIAVKSLKEATYHLAYSSEWTIRLGDGTEESHQKMQEALDDLVRFIDDLLEPANYEIACYEMGISPNPKVIKEKAMAKLKEVIAEATLKFPEQYFSRKGGKTGYSTEHLGYILAEMQFLQRAYPGATW